MMKARIPGPAYNSENVKRNFGEVQKAFFLQQERKIYYITPVMSIPMRTFHLTTFLSIILLFISCSKEAGQSGQQGQFVLWFDHPAPEWEQALPAGNGRLGIMDFGQPVIQRVQFNEESLWAGTKFEHNNPGAAEHLHQIRQLIFEHKNREAFELAERYLLSIPPRIRSYQTFGDLLITHQIDSLQVSGYRHELDLNRGVIKTSFTAENTEYSREALVSATDDLIAVHLRAEGPQKIHATISLSREKDAVVSATGHGTLQLVGQIIDPADPAMGPGGEHMKFAAILKVWENNGTCTAGNGSLFIKDASTVTLLLSAHTDYNRDLLNFDRSIDPLELCKSSLEAVSGSKYDRLRSSHIQQHRSVFERMDLSLGSENYDTIPTDIRLERVKAGSPDHDLIATYFQFGRYLLMGSSGFFATLPANLQGIWNPYLQAPWQSDYHTNINLQMNYWPAEVCNLSETMEPYTEFFTRVREEGEVTAGETYGAGGWTMHHVTDVFGYTAVNASVRWGMFPMAASWVCFPVFRHYQYTCDTMYLREQAWPLIRGAVEFVLDFLVEGPEGYLVTTPSYSPENAFVHPETGENTQLTYAPAMDIMIIRELFKYALHAMDVLDLETGLQSRMLATLDRLPPVKVGKDGTIREWIFDYEEAHPGHRHMSHLLGLHPGTSITPDTPELFEAAKRTIEKRLVHGGGHTGWSRAWIINFYARLQEEEKAFRNMMLLLQKSTLPNLFDTHPPFQIDGNLGGTAGIAEMLLQNRGDLIEVLPALPGQWADGYVKGICAKGGFELSFRWEDGVPSRVEVLSKAGRPCSLKIQDTTYHFDTEPGETVILTGPFPGSE